MAISTAIDASQVARAVGIETKFQTSRQGNVVFLPQRIAVIGQGSTAVTYATIKREINNANEAGSIYGFGSPIHLAVLQLLPLNGDGVRTIPVTVYPLVDDGVGVAATGNVAAIGTATKDGSYRVVINNIPSASFVILNGALGTASEALITTAINAVLEMPVTAVDDAINNRSNLTSKWEGTSANDITIAIEGPTDAGITFTIAQPSGGLVNPNIDTALNQVGDVWESLFLNCMDVADITTLGKLFTFGEGRRGPLTKKHMVAFVGNTVSGVSSATAVSDARPTDLINCQLVAPGSKDLPFVVAARQLTRIAVLANNNPPHGYGSQKATGLTPGLDSEQWDNTERDTAVKNGSSTVVVRDGVLNLADIVTMYHPTGDPVPAFRYVVDVVKLQNINNSINSIFENPSWDGAPLIPDNQATVNKSARKPKDAKAEISAMLDGLALNAIISDPESAKNGTIVVISATNPKRLDIQIPVKLSGNTNIISTDLLFSFFFGEQATA